jgi:hypothetical protein
MAKIGGQGTAAARARTYVSQGDVPGTSLERAIKIPAAIRDNYGYKPASPLQVAKALDVQPSSGGFRMLTGAAIAYGLTTGGYNADEIAITPLGLRIVRPLDEGDDMAAKREALLRPRVIREFLQKYDRAPVPKEGIAQNVLMELGVPSERALDVLQLILEGAQAVGFLQQIKDRAYVELGDTKSSNAGHDESGERSSENASRATPPLLPGPPPVVSSPSPSKLEDSRMKRVFITHGKNKDFIEPIKQLLSFGELEAVVAAENYTVSQPVPDKVMDDLRSCGAAIIHVDDGLHLVDKETNQHVMLNENVLIEIGAAMALFGKRFILVVKEGVTLPTNLQGLFEVRYTGNTLGDVTINLLKAINDMKKRPLPMGV